MFTKLNNLFAQARKSQVTIFFVIIFGLMLLFIVVVIDLHQVALSKLVLNIITDNAALSLGSSLVSFAKALSDQHIDGKVFTSKYVGNFWAGYLGQVIGWLLVVVIIIVYAVILYFTGGAGLVVAKVVGAFAGFMIGLLLTLTLTFGTWAIRENSRLNNAVKQWAYQIETFVDASTRYRETTLLGIFPVLAGDSEELPDIFDFDGDRQRDDKINRAVYNYHMRLRKISLRENQILDDLSNYPEVEQALKDLTALVNNQGDLAKLLHNDRGGVSVDIDPKNVGGIRELLGLDKMLIGVTRYNDAYTDFGRQILKADLSAMGLWGEISLYNDPESFLKPYRDRFAQALAKLRNNFVAGVYGTANPQGQYVYNLNIGASTVTKTLNYYQADPTYYIPPAIKGYYGSFDPLAAPPPAGSNSATDINALALKPKAVLFNVASAKTTNACKLPGVTNSEMYQPQEIYDPNAPQPVTTNPYGPRYSGWIRQVGCRDFYLSRNNRPPVWAYNDKLRMGYTYSQTVTNEKVNKYNMNSPTVTTYTGNGHVYELWDSTDPHGFYLNFSDLDKPRVLAPSSVMLDSEADNLDLYYGVGSGHPRREWDNRYMVNLGADTTEVMGDIGDLAYVLMPDLRLCMPSPEKRAENANNTTQQEPPTTLADVLKSFEQYIIASGVPCSGSDDGMIVPSKISEFVYDIYAENNGKSLLNKMTYIYDKIANPSTAVTLDYIRQYADDIFSMYDYYGTLGIYSSIGVDKPNEYSLDSNSLYGRLTDLQNWLVGPNYMPQYKLDGSTHGRFVYNRRPYYGLIDPNAPQTTITMTPTITIPASLLPPQPSSYPSGGFWDVLDDLKALLYEESITPETNTQPQIKAMPIVNPLGPKIANNINDLELILNALTQEVSPSGVSYTQGIHGRLKYFYDYDFRCPIVPSGDANFDRLQQDLCEYTAAVAEYREALALYLNSTTHYQTLLNSPQQTIELVNRNYLPFTESFVQSKLREFADKLYWYRKKIEGIGIILHSLREIIASSPEAGEMLYVWQEKGWTDAKGVKHPGQWHIVFGFIQGDELNQDRHKIKDPKTENTHIPIARIPKARDHSTATGRKAYVWLEPFATVSCNIDGFWEDVGEALIFSPDKDKCTLKSKNDFYSWVLTAKFDEPRNILGWKFFSKIKTEKDEQAWKEFKTKLAGWLDEKHQKEQDRLKDWVDSKNNEMLASGLYAQNERRDMVSSYPSVLPQELKTGAMFFSENDPIAFFEIRNFLEKYGIWSAARLKVGWVDNVYSEKYKRYGSKWLVDIVETDSKPPKGVLSGHKSRGNDAEPYY